jgi:hypothetical protein
VADMGSALLALGGRFHPNCSTWSNFPNAQSINAGGPPRRMEAQRVILYCAPTSTAYGNTNISSG